MCFDHRSTKNCFLRLLNWIPLVNQVWLRSNTVTYSGNDSKLSSFFVGMPYNWSFYHPQSHKENRVVYCCFVTL